MGDTETYGLQNSSVLRKRPDGQRIGPAADWAALNPVLERGEIGVTSDTGVLKVGDGTSRWATLSGISGGGGGAVSSVDGLTGAVDLSGTYGRLDGATWTGTQDFTGATVTGIAGGGGAVDSVVGQTGDVTGTQILSDSTVAAALSAKAPLASPAFTGTPTAPTPPVGDNSTKLATTAFVLANNQTNLGNASGDATGATDYATIQAALTAARTAGGGQIVGKPGQTYLINNTLSIGTGVELVMTGCTVRMVTGTNKLMLANYSSLNPITTTGKATVANGGTLWTLENTSDPAYVAMAADAGKGAGWTFDVPATIGGVSVRFVGTLGPNGMNTGTRQFGLIGSQAFPGTTFGAYTAFKLYARDSRIIVRGGIWDRQDNGSGDTETNHAMRWRGADGVIVRDVTFLSTVFNNGRYAMLVQNVTSLLVDGVTYGLNPNQGSWSGSAGYARDGVHITGPTSNVIVRNVFGFPGDDMVAITASDFAGTAGDYWGHVTDITIEDIRPTKAGQCAIKVMGGPSAQVKRILVRNVYGSSSGTAGFVTIGDDNRQASTSGGIFDDITLENIFGTPGTNRSLITIVSPNVGRVTIRNAGWDNAASTAPGVISLGDDLYASGAVATTVASLVVEGLSIQGLNAATRAVNVGSGSVVNVLECIDWRNPGAILKTIGGSGTIRLRRFSSMPYGALTRITQAGRWYPATPTTGTGQVFQVLTQDKLYLGLPRVAQDVITIDQIGFSSNIVGSAGAVARLGLYLIDTEDPYALRLTSAWATLIAGSEGTVATDGTTGTKTMTLPTPAVIGPGQAFACGLVHQVAGPASIALRSGSNIAQMSPWGGTAPAAGAAIVVSMSGVTGALPSSFVPAAFEGMNAFSDHGLFFRAA